MPLPAWIALLLLLFATTLGAVHLFLRARRLWRTLKSFGSALDGAVAGIDGIRAADAAGLPRLDASLERLRVSLARAAVLRAAVQDARNSLGRLAAVYPRK